jgi:iron complex outermembrane receptor protein/vitamin B12 transporter
MTHAIRTLASILIAGVAPLGFAEMESLTVVGTRLDLGEEQRSGQLSIIDREQITALNKESVEQLLQALPGVSINRQGGAGGVTSFYVRGGEANFAVVMIDGVQVNNPTNTRGGSFDFSTLDVSMIERIELIRGPQSAVYGADALSGALNIVTRRADPEGSAIVRAELGKDDYYRGTAFVGGALGNSGQFGLTAGRTDSGDIVEDSEHDINFFNGKLDYTFSDSLRGRAALRYSDSDRSSFPEDSGGSDYAVVRELDHADAEDWSALAGLELDISETWRSAVTASWYSTDGNTNSPGIFPGTEVPPTSDDVNFDRYHFNWTNQLQFERGRMSLGAEFEREEGDSQGTIDFGILIPTEFELDRDSTGVFAEGEYQLTDILRLSAGFRYDDIDDVDSETTSRLGALLSLFEGNTQLRANWGEGFKAPSFFALAHPLVGNPNLDSETSTSWDVGIEQYLLDRQLVLNLAWFDAEYKDLIDFDDDLFINVNRDQVDSSGVEFTADYLLGSAGRISAHATYQDLDIQDSDEELRGRPEWKAGAQFFYRFNAEFSMTAEYLWVDEVVEASRYTGENVDYTLDSYQTVDVNLAWQVLEPLKMELSVNNLFDENYEQAVGFPSAGIFPRLAVEYAF